MVNLLIDTDIGIDCDDAVALEVACRLEIAGSARVVGVNVSTARKGGAAAARAVLASNGFVKEVGQYKGMPLACDGINVYGEYLYEKYGQSDEAEDSTSFFRRILSRSRDKITLVTIGPLNAMNAFVNSAPDDISPLSGMRLLEEKVDKIFIMGGNFTAYTDAYGGKYASFPEWNIAQDVKSAKSFINDCSVPMIFSPFETGVDVLSGKNLCGGTPCLDAIKKFYEVNPEEFRGELVRSSWDPITVCEAAGINLFALSEKGAIKVDDVGNTLFYPGQGESRFLIGGDNAKTASAIENILRMKKDKAV